jgi:mycofactocin precursor
MGDRFSSLWGIVFNDDKFDYYANGENSGKGKQLYQFNHFNQFKTGRKIMNEKHIEHKEEVLQVAAEEQKGTINSDIYTIREIEIEEVAIDGICGVY